MLRLSLILPLLFLSVSTLAADPLPGTKPLTWEGDITSRLVDECDAFLLRRLEESIANRPNYWGDNGKPSVETLKKQLGLVDERVPFDALELITTTKESSLVGQFPGGEIHRVRWPVFGGVHGEGLYLKTADNAKAWAIVLPDADQTPEQLCGLVEGVPSESQLPLKLAASGVNVIVPALISRKLEKRNGRANLTHREYLHRPAFILGRTMTGYEVQKVLALVDWISQTHREMPLGVAGYGEGGMIALYAGAVDDRIDVTLVSGYFENRQDIWKQPITRQVFGLLREFGDAELASMIGPGKLLIEPARGPEVTLPGEGGAPAELTPASLEEVRAEFDRIENWGAKDGEVMLLPVEQNDRFFGSPALRHFQSALGVEQQLVNVQPESTVDTNATFAQERLTRQIAELDRHNQEVMNESPYVRKEFLKDLDTSSLAAYEKSVEPYREIFREEVIGEYDLPLDPFNARSRKTWETDKWVGYEVVLDVFDGVFAYGALLLPKDLKGPDDKRPVVVCQHGLEGRPTDTFLNDHRAYHDFAGKLAERGFITFCPQNIYIFKDRFRTLQRKSYPLGTTLFSLIVPQHQQIVNWLQTLPNVDGDRIGFYGLSYGGKSAMRIPALVTDYALSICSADFNEWVRKNASTRLPYSYVWTGEYEIYEFNLGGTFNYAEMAALIAPRPFMVERGHFDGVGWDEWVAYEFAKVRYLYAAKLGIGDRTEIEYFVGPHTINGQGTFDFLHKHLNWPQPD
ncbi:MAG: dienelactone hydrolase family protein [Planctomycetaceae bacterium]|nr:dienelactone hydrolase family protein [Planctomycetaceae bacterium]